MSVTEKLSDVLTEEAGGESAVGPARGPESTPEVHLKLRATRGFAALNLREVWQFRDLLWTLAGRDIKVRYKQTALGVIWIILQPLLGAGIFSFVFGKVAKMPSDNIPYLVFSYAGLQGWMIFNSVITRVSSCLVANANLVSKVYFPRLVLPLSTMPSILLDFGVAMGMLAVLMVVYEIVPGWGLLLLPLWMAMLMTIAMGVGLWAAALMVAYRDISYIVPVALQMLMYGSPIAYAASVVPEQYRFIYYLNPLASLLEAFRWSLLGRGRLEIWALTMAGGEAIVLLFIGLYVFKGMERKFADTM